MSHDSGYAPELHYIYSHRTGFLRTVRPPEKLSHYLLSVAGGKAHSVRVNLYEMNIQYICPLLRVFDMEASLAFYVDILGFTVRESAGDADDVGWVWLSKNDINLMLNTQFESPDRPAHPESHRVITHQDTVLYLGCPDVDDTYKELKSKGLKMKPPRFTSYGMRQLYLHDPDGYGLCFQCKHE